MDKNELKAMMVSIILMVVFITVLFVARASNTLNVPQCVPGVDPGSFTTGLMQKGDKKYDLFILAKMWSFDMGKEVKIPVGSEVDIYLTSKDVMHSMNIYKKAISMMAAYGAVNKVTVKFDEKGSYSLVCGEYCGSAHQNMAGEIIVE